MHAGPCAHTRGQREGQVSLLLLQGVRSYACRTCVRLGAPLTTVLHVQGRAGHAYHDRQHRLPISRDGPPAGMLAAWQALSGRLRLMPAAARCVVIALQELQAAAGLRVLIDGCVVGASTCTGCAELSAPSAFCGLKVGCRPAPGSMRSPEAPAPKFVCFHGVHVAVEPPASPGWPGACLQAGSAHPLQPSACFI